MSVFAEICQQDFVTNNYVMLCPVDEALLCKRLCVYLKLLHFILEDYNE